MTTRLFTAILAACCFLISSSTFAVDEPADDLVASLKETNTLLKKENTTLEERVDELERESEELKKELEELKAKLDTKSGKSRKAEPDKPDLLAVGSSWTGHLDGRDANGNEFHQATTAVIVSRDEKTCQIRTTIQDGVEWVYDCALDKRVYRISKATLTKAPPGFPTKPGMVRIAGSEISTSVVKGQRILRIAVTRPIGSSGVNAVYTLALDE